MRAAEGVPAGSESQPVGERRELAIGMPVPSGDGVSVAEGLPVKGLRHGPKATPANPPSPTEFADEPLAALERIEQWSPEADPAPDPPGRGEPPADTVSLNTSIHPAAKHTRRAPAQHHPRAGRARTTAPPDPTGKYPQPAPRPVLDRFRRLTHVELGDVRVWRGPEVSARARRLGARAYTEGGEVHLPDEAGALDGPAAPLLAHELTHVVHQRTHGSALPDESTVAGQGFEAEAVAVEQWFGGVPQRQPVTALQRAEEPVPGRLADAVQSLKSDAPPVETRTEPEARPPRRWADLDSVDDLEELANRLYERLHRRFRLGLLIDRERAGTLTDFR